MFKVTEYDLNSEVERVGLYQDVVEKMQDRKKIISDKPRLKYEISEEERKQRSVEASISRARTRVRRLAQRYQLKYMWTLTFKETKVEVKNRNGSTSYYDTSNIDDVFKLWTSFLKRCSRAGIKFDYICTVEVQEKRLKKYGDKVYHFHFITNKKLPINSVQAIKMGYRKGINELWGHGYTFVSKPRRSQENKVYLYIVKYLTKLIEEMGVGRQRYRVSQGMYIPKEVYFLSSHIEFLKMGETFTYTVLGDELEIFFQVVKKEKG